ncbi:hypothetical protein [Vibrio quintilis]|uniref:EF-hand domain-containing protein n=1 Tax=Vibrio quintilis TaxID=1117707 RepID=A0A1M7Z0G3_9VIBR|nr:hypothetical protein [Vibrio quintilis]SHO58408.1 hypothetical protein VQ7734_04180 [Vibrio quintilis]
MKFVFPMTKDNGEEYPDQQSLETQLKREKSGQFGYNPNNKSWHGGLHFTENNAKWLKRQQAIRAIADGKIVACRIGSDYQVAEFKGQQLTYSNDFCLIEHEADYKEGDVDKTFTFYSLYQHLAPHCEPHVAIGLGRRYVMTKTRFARAQAGKQGEYAKLEKDVVIEETDEKPVVKDGYEFRKFNVVDNPGDGKGIADTGKDVWIAVRETKNLLKRFSMKEDTLSGQYKMTKSDRNVRKHAGLKGRAETLPAGALFEVVDKPEIIKDGYEFRVIRIVDSKGVSTDLIKNGSELWIAVASGVIGSGNLLKAFALKLKNDNDITGQYKMTKSDRNVRKQAGTEGHAEKLHKDTVIEITETSPVIKNGYEFWSVKIIDNKGTNTTLVKNGAQVWLACRTSKEIFSSFTTEVSPDWMVDGVIATVFSNGLTVRSDPDATKNIGDKIATAKHGTRFFYQKTQHYGLFNLNGRKRLFARCKFVDGDVKTEDGKVLDAGWLCVESKYIHVVVARKPLEMGQFHQLGSSSAYTVCAGDPIGYLGRYDKVDTRREDFTKLGSQIHFEVFSKDKPPEGFFKLFMNDESVKQLRWIEDKDSDGFVDKPDPPFLFQEVTRLVSGGEGAQAFTQVEDALLPWDSFKSIVAYHESEWYPKAAEKSFLDDFLDKYKHALMKDIIEHEKERIDQLVWMQDEVKIGFGPLVWHWWPVMDVRSSNKLIWIKKVEQKFGSKIADEFKQKIISVGEELEIDPNYIIACIALETVQSFDPATKNPGSSATGLIQFMKKTAEKDLDTTIEQLAKMTHVEQMDYVKKYFKLQAKYVGVPTSKWTLEDVYFSIFTPSVIRKSNDDVIYLSGDERYEKNKFHDINKDKKITKKEIAHNIREYYQAGFKYEG